MLQEFFRHSGMFLAGLCIAPVVLANNPGFLYILDPGSKHAGVTEM
jgi:hypothetical protein